MPHEHRQKLDRISTPIDATIGTLAARTPLAAGTRTPTQNFQAALHQGVVNARSGTVGETVALVVANGDLTLAEVEEALEAVPTHGRDAIPLEQSRREVQYLGQIGLEQPLYLNLGNRLAMFREEVGWKYWVYNSTSASMTTGMLLSGQLYTFGTWKD